MKYVLTVLLLTALVFAQSAPTNSSESAAPTPDKPQAFPADLESARKARTIVDQAIQALGGQAYLNAQDMTQEGRSYSFHHGQPNTLRTAPWPFPKFPH